MTDVEKLAVAHIADGTLHVTDEKLQQLQEVYNVVESMDTATIAALCVDIVKAKSIITDTIYAGNAYFTKVDTDLLTANQVISAAIKASFGSFDYIDTEYIKATTIVATYATIENLNAVTGSFQTLLADYIKATDVIADNITVNTILGEIAKFKEVTAMAVDAQSVLSFTITSDYLAIANAFIKSAMIDSLSADKVNTGILNTNMVNIQSTDGRFAIKGNTLQIKDSANTVRVQIGLDANNDYDLYLWDATGALMFDAQGMKAAAIKSAIIIDNMIAGNANIDGSKLNIDSIITHINANVKTIDANKITYDGNTLDVVFGNITTTTTNLGEEISLAQTDITAIQGKFATKVWQSDIDTATGAMSAQYSTLTQTVDGINSTVGALNTKVNTKVTSTAIISTINQTAEAIKISATHLDLTGLVTITNLSTAGQTTINGSNIKTGIIQSSNYNATTGVGSQLNLDTGAFNSKYFKTATDGSIIATAGKIGNWSINPTTLSGVNAINGVPFINYLISGVTKTGLTLQQCQNEQLVAFGYALNAGTAFLVNGAAETHILKLNVRDTATITGIFLGTFSITGTTNGNWTSLYVSFGVTLVNAPKVFLQQRGGTSVENIRVTSPTVKGFTVQLFGCLNFTSDYDYLAICGNV